MKRLLSTLTAFVLFLTATQAQIVITEIMYNPAEAGTDSSEFIELYNAGSTTVDLQGYYFSAGVVDTFLVSTPIAPGGYVVTTFNAAYFQARYGVAATKQWISGALSNAGEAIVLKNGSGVVVDSVFFDDVSPWPFGAASGEPDGGGSSLVLCNPALDNADGANWSSSTSVVGGGLIVNTFPVTSSPFAADASCPTALELNFAVTGVTVNENAGTITVDVTIANPNGNPTSVDVVVNAASTATGVLDYTFTTATLIFPASSSANQTASITIVDDILLETAETIVLELTNPTNGAVLGSDSLHTITITDNDGTPELNFGAAGVTVNENAGSVTVNVTIANPNSNATSVDVIVNAASTATGGGTDYTYTTATLTFPANSSTNQTASVTIVDDALLESAETIVLELTNATNGAILGGDSLYTITINDNDAPLANLVITEINYNPAGTDSIEFIEIYNNGSTTVDLAGYQFTSGIIFTFPTYNLAAGQYMIITNDSAKFHEYFGVATLDWGGFSSTNGALSLNNGTGEALVLTMPGGAVVDSVFYRPTAPWPTGAAGTGASIQLCDVNSDNADGTNWRNSTNNTGVVYAGFPVLATLAMANTICPPPGVYTYHHISEINGVDANGVPVNMGDSVELRGVVHCSDFNSANVLDFFLLEYNNVGIKVYSAVTISNYTVNAGDSLNVWGVIGQLNGVLRVTVDSILLVSSGNPTVTPMVVTAINESTESKLIQLNNVYLVDPAQWTGTGSGFSVDVTNGTDTFEVFVDNDIDLYTQPAPTGTFHIYGFGYQYDTSNPFDSGYELLPCSSSITPVVAVKTVFANNNVNIFPNPAYDVLHVRANNIESIVVTNMLGQTVAQLQNVNDTYTTVNTAELPSGVYNITVINNGQLSTKQFVKK